MTPQTSKELVNDLFAFRDLTRIPFIPWVGSYAAQLEQVQIKTLLSDAGLLSRSLINAQKLFGYDAIINIFDSSVEAEACGCKIDWSHGTPQVTSHPISQGAAIEALNTIDIEKHGRIPIVLEATRRLKIIKGKEVAVIGYLTGPLTLARHLTGETFLSLLSQDEENANKIMVAAGNIGLKLCRLYCELGVDAIVIAEEMLRQISPGQYQVLASSLRSIWNVARFYKVHSLILSKGCSNAYIEPALNLHAEGISLSGDLDYIYLRNEALKRNSCYSRGIENYGMILTAPWDNNRVNGPTLEKRRGFFLSTEWEVPFSTNVNTMHEVMRFIGKNQSS